MDNISEELPQLVYTMDNMNGLRAIGGMFGLEEALNKKGCPPPFLKDRAIFMVNARSCISVLIELLSPTNIWMPSYLCDSMLEAIDKSTDYMKFYEVDYDLAVPSLEWLNDVQKGDLIVIIDYFGFLFDSAIAIRAKEKGAWVLEDAAQALLSMDLGKFSDFTVYSPRKFLGVPDGGILISNCNVDLGDLNLKIPPEEWWLKALLATIFRRKFDIYDGKNCWFELYKEVEAQQPIGHYAMSHFSKALLMHSFDYPIIAERRVRNYRTLMELLGDHKLFPKLPNNVVPLGFPIRLKNRDRIRQILIDKRIYPPIHWSINEFIPGKFRDSYKLADHIMTLPCDQRYNHFDMTRMAQIVLSNIH